ncbi:MAG: 4Fe-4S dicluster domain-containing protein [Bacteroidetes bacterium]|nr:4Fe-4S dicluster domain-containing protein [Bacteroidota bacterium]
MIFRKVAKTFIFCTFEKIDIPGMLQSILIAFGIILTIVFITAIIISICEGEKKAVLILLFTAIILITPFFLLLVFPFFTTVSFLLAGIIFTLLILFILPLKGKLPEPTGAPVPGIDERTTMFSRRELKQDILRFNDYYKQHPEHKTPDDQFRKEPGLLSTQSRYAHTYGFASAKASFATVGYLAAGVTGHESMRKQNIDPDALTKYIKAWTKKLGALDTGITGLQDYHLYTVAGRGNRYGKIIFNNHRFAIAFTVEMDYKMMSAAPAVPTVMESAQKYLSSGAIAIQIAHFIRELGYEARAHIDANYELICPIVARDAGLGEIGRMGLLLTPKHGPRVRIAVVTTNIPLIKNQEKNNLSVLDFCNHCKKCVDVCPAQAIPKAGRRQISGNLRWQINSEACYTYWCLSGTDCGKCVVSCPYAHPDNLLHRVIRTGVSRNFIFRQVAVRLDDLFYGKKPKSKSYPGWIRSESESCL